MKKTILKVIILAFFILLHKDTVYAGDEISFTINNEPPQDALIIGRVSEVYNNQNFISIGCCANCCGEDLRRPCKFARVDTAKYKKGDCILFFLQNLWRIKMVLHNVVLYITITKLLLKQIIRFAFCQVRTIQGHFAAELEWFVNTGEQRVNEEIYDYDKDKWLKKIRLINVILPQM